MSLAKKYYCELRAISHDSSIRGLMKNVVLLLYCALLLSLLSCGPSGNRDQSFSADQQGYYKSDTNVRVFTINLTQREGFTLQNLANHGDRQSHTAGRMTYVFYYTNGAAPNPTMAGGIERALDIAYSVDCYAIFTKMANGEGSLVLCD